MSQIVERPAPEVSHESPASRALYEEACKYIPGGTSRLHNYFHPNPIYIRSGHGCRITDVDGVERIDFLNNMTSLIHGHAHPHITGALVEQLARGTAYSEPCEAEVALARLLSARVASIEKIRFANSGTEAVMMALKLAREFTGRAKVAKFEGFYHGYYDYVQVSYTPNATNWGPRDTPASVASSGGLAGSVEAEVLVLPFNDREGVERLLERHAGEVAALIMDPLSQQAGFPHPEPEFYTYLREITRRYEILLIYDEVISFRLGHHGAQGIYGGEPDLTALGKIMGGGLPVGAVGGRADVMDLLDPSRSSPRLASGGTFSANPFTMTSGYAAMELLDPAEFARINALGARLRNEANAALSDAHEPAQVAGDGSLFKILMTSVPVRDYRDVVSTSAPIERSRQLHRNLLDEGIVVSNALLGALSTPMGGAEVEEFVAALDRAVARLRSAGTN
jgi:glutamate-1-semialdehyde 2,1-aminomutase